ncbi:MULTISPECIES: SDR family oxidoreductase [unclassified Aureispira]|uniref:SDR family NAD(P)-dependent oxidoreductase n=1 Tax=unclassified Aureispira TaxID=2649989 RepID=UPI0006967978|nr:MULTISPECIES: SDR family oxidoreductase [unclassified Aureispira]WMX16748.1 SDR family oxidoreductase [Aureispira sp. CCB-E]
MKKVALITGASSGIGKEFAFIHAEKGGDLILIARSEDKLNRLKAELEQKYSVNVKIIVKDLTETNATLDIYNEIKDDNITVDYLINNAGFGGQGKFHERAWKDDLAMIHLNIIALTSLTRYFLPDFVARNNGKILNVSSTASLLPGPLQAVYYATKAYVTSFSNAIAEELHDTNITVTALLPGATETGFADTSGMDKTDLFAQAASARSVALDGYNAMLAGKLDVISGLTFTQKMMMAAIPITPKKMLLTQIRKMQEIQ